MIRLLRLAAILLVWATAAFALQRWCWIPYRCSLVEQQVQKLTLRIASLPDEPAVRTAARRNLAAMRPCLGQTFAKVNQLMIAAANYRMLDRADAAIGLYERALQLDRRPELYLNLGLAQIEAGRTKDGIDNLVHACVYNPEFLDEISLYHDEIKHGIDEYQTQMHERLTNAAR